jgi:hypothetical protein
VATWPAAAGQGALAGRGLPASPALFTWKFAAADVSRMAGHTDDRITLDMYVGTTVGVLNRARTATQ